MNCPKCSGKLEAVTTRFSKKLGVVTRKRVCNLCKYTVNTVEVSRETFEKDDKLIKSLEKVLNIYNDENVRSSNDV